MEEHATLSIHEASRPEGLGVVRRRLGRGLQALLGGAGGDEPHAAAPAALPASGPAAADPTLVHVELIEKNPFQPRVDFDPQTLQELTDSIKQHGILQPLLVRPHGGQYQLIAGERRLLAAIQAGLDTVPCRVLELDDKSVCEAAIEENLKRKDLNVLEKAQAFRDYIERFHSSIEDLARQLSMDRSTVSNYLRLLDLPDAVKKALREDKISNGHARALLTLAEADQIALCKRIQAESLSVRKTEEAVRELQNAGQPDTVPFPDTSQKPAELAPTSHVLSLQQQLQEQLGVKVEIRQSGPEAGKIILTFKTNDEFERIVRHLCHAA